MNIEKEFRTPLAPPTRGGEFIRIHPLMREGLGWAHEISAWL